jgi:hypothetical protein
MITKHLYIGIVTILSCFCTSIAQPTSWSGRIVFRIMSAESNDSNGIPCCEYKISQDNGKFDLSMKGEIYDMSYSRNPLINGAKVYLQKFEGENATLHPVSDWVYVGTTQARKQDGSIAKTGEKALYNLIVDPLPSGGFEFDYSNYNNGPVRNNTHYAVKVVTAGYEDGMPDLSNSGGNLIPLAGISNGGDAIYGENADSKDPQNNGWLLGGILVEAYLIKK